ncbi:MAG: hypothetical protein NXI04_05000 [Planctomycetaceae bacterium]|nr:hypothetical protein [Planctomycetaceae bacterium]
MNHAGICRPLIELALLLATTAGCENTAPGLVPATASVTLDGRPLASGSVTLYHQNMAAGTGQIVDGTCHLNQSTNTRGVAPGHYQAAVQCWEVPPHAVQPDGTIGGPGRSFIPDRYTSAVTSGLSVDIGNQATDFELQLLSK